MRFRRALPLLLVIGLAACLGPASAGGPLHAVPHPLSQQDPGHTRLGAAEVLGILELRAGERWFGGISGMILDGDRLVAVNDSGHWLSMRLETDETGRPLAVSELNIAPLGGLDGSRDDGDAEELVATPDGLMVAFERRHRLWLYPDGLSGKPKPLAAPQGFTRLPANGGAEAVAALGDGRLLVIAEEGDETLSPAWLGRPGAWERLSYRRHGQFRPTGATLLPGGDVLVVERRFTWLGGMAMRLVRLDGAAFGSGAVLQGREVALLEPPLTVDNYEAVAVRPRPLDGRLVAYLMSDDNFFAMQATLLMAVLLP